MKKFFIGFIILSAQLYSCSSTSQVSGNVAVSSRQVSYQTFYDELTPYGHWVNYADYGYVWMPAAESNFKPYSSNGHWIYTDMGWTWASDYKWGWAPFHYGRWAYEQTYGWMWIPGYEWAPAWVAWRRSPEYYGWAPLGPRIDIRIGSAYNPGPAYWCFVPHRYINHPHINNYYINETKNVTIINNTTVVNNTTTVNKNVTKRYFAGPEKSDVEKMTNSKLQPLAITESNQPGSAQQNDRTLVVYKPRIKNNEGQKGVPKKVETLDEVKRNNPVNITGNVPEAKTIIPPAGGAIKVENDQQDKVKNVPPQPNDKIKEALIKDQKMPVRKEEKLNNKISDPPVSPANLSQPPVNTGLQHTDAGIKNEQEQLHDNKIRNKENKKNNINTDVIKPNENKLNKPVREKQIKIRENTPIPQPGNNPPLNKKNGPAFRQKEKPVQN